MEFLRSHLRAFKGTNRVFFLHTNYHAKHDSTSQSGRTMVELLGVLAMIILLTLGMIKIYHEIVNNTKVQNTAKMIRTLALERQNSSINSSMGSRNYVKGPHSDLYIENGTEGKFVNYFWIITNNIV